MGVLGRALLLPAATALATLSLAAPPADEAGPGGADVPAVPPISAPALEVPPEPPDVPIVRDSPKWVERKTYGGQPYEGLVRLECEHLNREKRSRERFVLVCPTQGPLARVPVYIEYQPKWWFKVEGVLDASATLR